MNGEDVKKRAEARLVVRDDAHGSRFVRLRKFRCYDEANIAHRRRLNIAARSMAPWPKIR